MGVWIEAAAAATANDGGGEIMRNILSIEATDTTQTSLEPNMGTPTKGADDQSFHQRRINGKGHCLRILSRPD